jgi:hypothetical protein
MVLRRSTEGPAAPLAGDGAPVDAGPRGPVTLVEPHIVVVVVVSQALGDNRVGVDGSFAQQCS